MTEFSRIGSAHAESAMIETGLHLARAECALEGTAPHRPVESGWLESSSIAADFVMVERGVERESLGVSSFEGGISLNFGPGEDDRLLGDLFGCHDQAGRWVGA